MSLPEAIVTATSILGGAHIAVWLIRLAHEDACQRRSRLAAEETYAKFNEQWLSATGHGRQKPKTGN